MMRAIFLFFLISAGVFGEQSYQPREENLQARKWFQDSKFGLFIHWGPYSVLENGEWILEQSKLSLEEYENLATSKFNPIKFDPGFLVALAKKKYPTGEISNPIFLKIHW